ncbi:winged helix-turn-helix domain-containing tetratricopeptide repeat protein [Thetidibacter halocola]|uniref:Winged helix-turn-helix domain-containing protein n=1 Tax=Thetidibacter halocola TaxID=2827239 RepID=A0A8J8BBR4_9RHOB|nr:winged helix-turn-helix domain-containing tetratricopeptide repeat protein [Thetidibacter halocola]MBS0126498.1 winged helix-turn-helix domain-containing protein [Thetidibacter halocola]
MSSFRFGEFLLSTEERKLSRDGIELPLGARAFDMLSFMVENRHRVLTKAEILDAVWPEIAVEESNLTVQVSALRKVLGPKALATIPGRGYQFVLSVGENTHVPVPDPDNRETAFTEVLVLPFTNSSNDPDQEYFADGITEDVITDLSKVAALSVVARNTAFTFKGRAVNVAQTARDMNLTHVVEGSVRKSGNRIRINAQLVDGATGRPIWAERFDRDLADIFDLQDEITEAIVAALKVRLVPAERVAIQSRPTDNPEAYELYLQARYHHTRLDRRNFEIASRLAQRALEIDPDFGLAWALLAISQTGLYGFSASPEHGLEAAERALALNPNLAEALAAKAFVLAGLGRFDEAFELHERSLQLDPNSYDVRFLYGRTCFQTGRHDEAILHWERATELSEADLAATTHVAMCYRATGQHEKVLDTARRTLVRAERVLSENSSDSYALISGINALARLGEAERTRQWAVRVKAIDPDDPSIDYNIACAMALLGETETALDTLEACLPRVDPVTFSVWVEQDNDLDALRDLPRFQRLVRDLDARTAAATV